MCTWGSHKLGLTVLQGLRPGPKGSPGKEGLWLQALLPWAELGHPLPREKMNMLQAGWPLWPSADLHSFSAWELRRSSPHSQSRQGEVWAGREGMTTDCPGGRRQRQAGSQLRSHQVSHCRSVGLPWPQTSPQQDVVPHPSGKPEAEGSLSSC